jgi:predicted Rossmann fold flavoprotein
VTHACFEVPELVKCYPRGTSLLKKSLHHFSPRDTIRWFSDRGVTIVEEPDGRMFPVTNDAQTIIGCIWQELMKERVQVRFNNGVKRVVKENGVFRVILEDGTQYVAAKVMLACGSILKAEHFEWLTAMGHTLQQPAPSLFTFNLPKNPITQLMGVSVPDAGVKITGTKFVQQGSLLITHWGFSGPAVLRTSAWAARYLQDQHYEFTVLINWLGGLSEGGEGGLREQFLSLRQQQGKSLVHGRNPFELPRRLWDFLLERCEVGENTRWGDLPAAAQSKLILSLVQDAYVVKGKTTFKEEFVTCGGVTTSEINPQTMESRLVPGLYFGGEAMDVDGITGGYNFQHAWCSGWLAARGMGG